MAVVLFIWKLILGASSLKTRITKATVTNIPLKAYMKNGMSEPVVAR
jgi:hypothetical protein